MRLGTLEVVLTKAETLCDNCRNEAPLTIDGQPQCFFHAGERLRDDPEVLATLTLELLALRAQSK